LALGQCEILIPPCHEFPMMSDVSPRWRYRAAIFSRTLVAAVGGYVLAAAGSALSAQAMVLWLGVARTSAVTGAAMLAFILHAIAAVWVFACTTTLRAWLGVGIPALAAALLAWWLTPPEGMTL